MADSPTSRSLKECKRLRWTADVVERRVTRTIKRDYLGIIDLIAVTPPCEQSGAGPCCIFKLPYDRTPGSFTCATCGWTNHNAPGRTIGIQATSGANHRARVLKAKREPRLRAWLDAGNEFEVWSWAKKGPRGKRKRWTLRVEAVSP